MRRKNRAAALTIAIVTAGFMCCLSAVAFAYNENLDNEDLHASVITQCRPCHAPDQSGMICSVCHPSHGNYSPAVAKGPHGLYTSATDRCAICHSVHVAGGAKLLSAATVTASCNACHDGTGGSGVYGAIFARTGVDPDVTGGEHSVDTTSVIPGGDASTGGSATRVFSGPGGTLGCDDCHSPHDSQVVTGFPSERWRSSLPISTNPIIQTSKLLRQRPGDAATATAEYGSDWCLACHEGRVSGGALHNHPVDSSSTASPPFVYERVARLQTDEPTQFTVIGALANSNRGYLMPFPRTPEQSGHAPICQQCHEDARSVGTVTDDTGDAIPFSIVSTDGADPADNPLFQNFPHETVNIRMLVEGAPSTSADDLCLNCHPVSQLP